MSAKKLSYQELSDENSKLKKHIRQIEKRYNVLVESTPDIIMNIDPEGKIFSVNKSFAGLTVKALSNMNILNLIPANHSGSVFPSI